MLFLGFHVIFYERKLSRGGMRLESTIQFIPYIMENDLQHHIKGIELLYVSLVVVILFGSCIAR